ncbi:MAG: DUF3299 domain-containing protein [Cyanobacteria bacterium J06642_2]
MKTLAAIALATAAGLMSASALLPKASFAQMTQIVAASRSARQIGWEDLMPEPDYEDPFAQLSIEQTTSVMFIADVREQQARYPDMETDPAFEEYVQEELDSLLAAGIEVDRLIAEWDATREARIEQASAINPELNDAQIRMPGYVLPLEFTDTKITEFLLVPYVGACIHVPPPPPNQIVLVQVPEGMKSAGMFEPVWVTGTIAAQAVSKNLEVSDGDIDVNIGYGLQANLIEPYKH